jgi:hypothetical protein
MKILILFEHANHYLTIDSLCANLVSKGAEVASFNITYWRFRKWTGRPMPLWIRPVSLLAKIPGIRGVLTKWFRAKAMADLCAPYDVVDIHFFSDAYDRLIGELKSRGKKIKITIWGSDFYKARPARREKQRALLVLADIIQTETLQVAEDFKRVFPEVAGRVRIAHFGIQFDVIDQLLAADSQEGYKNLAGVAPGRTVLTCGTNGSEGHQHLKILESVEQLDQGIRERLFLILPMNYGGNQSYTERVRARAETTGIPFMILTTFLSLREMCKYRIASDITVTIQATDSLSSAIQEHIYTGEILVTGDWLPYGVLDEYGVFYLKASLDSLGGVLADAIQNYSSYSEKCRSNREKISAFSAWDHVIGDWMDIYQETGTNGG